MVRVLVFHSFPCSGLFILRFEFSFAFVVFVVGSGWSLLHLIKLHICFKFHASVLLIFKYTFGERWNVPFASLNGTFHLSPDQSILTIALMNIHYLFYIIPK